MNTNGKHTLGEAQAAQSRGTTAALVGITAMLMVAFLCGGLVMLLIGQPVIVNMVAACLSR